MTAKQKVGWIGLGKMGLPMAHNLAKAGYEIAAYNRSRGKTDGLAGDYDQVSAVDSPAEAARGADIVVSMISDDRVLETVTLGAGGIVEAAEPGLLFVDMSTVSPMASARVAAALAEKNVAFLRAPVMGSIPVAERGELMVMSSGPKEELERARPVLEILSRKIHWVGEAEQSRYLKLSINLQIGIIASLLGEALAFGHKGGMDWDQLIDIMAESPVGSPIVKFKAPYLKARDFTATFSIEQMGKDLDLALATARDMEVPMPIAASVRQQYAAMISKGHGELDFCAQVLLAEEMAGLTGGDGS